ncbi:MAG: polyprenyl synthetase family protein [Rickettsiales bacterium]
MNILEDKLLKNSELLNKAIANILEGDEEILSPMHYSAVSKGKNIRSFIFLELLESFGERRGCFLEVAAAIEILHTYSLIHDDLPSMDNSNLRRGKAASHKKFDEATAVLTGDALLTLSFEVIASIKSLDPDIKIDLIRELANASGYKGMIEGQVLDIKSQNSQVTLEQLKHMYFLKTGKLFKFCAIAPCIISGDIHSIPSMEKFAYNLGMLYQITDDIIDSVSDKETSGKDQGKDLILNKTNFVTLLGTKKAISFAKEYKEKCLFQLNKLSTTPQSLLHLVDFIFIRKS